ncbi:MAG: hypothetical protein ACI9OJ_004860 [Myxococcota bacterium]
MRWKSLLNVIMPVKRGVIESAHFSESDGSLIIRVRPDARSRHRYPHCSGRCPRYDGGHGDRRWRSLHLGICRVWLVTSGVRVSCPVHGVVSAAVPWARHGARFTSEFEDQAAWLATRTDKTSVTELLRIGWRTVERITAHQPPGLRIPQCSVVHRAGHAQTRRPVPTTPRTRLMATISTAPVFAALTDIKGRPRHARHALRPAGPLSSVRLRVAPGVPLTSSRHGSIARAQSLVTHWNDRRAVFVVAAHSDIGDVGERRLALLHAVDFDVGDVTATEHLDVARGVDVLPTHDSAIAGIDVHRHHEANGGVLPVVPVA